jgi:hypothetical protein
MDALVRALRPGRHIITIELVTTDFAATSTYVLNVLSRGHSDPESEND